MTENVNKDVSRQASRWKRGVLVVTQSGRRANGGLESVTQLMKDLRDINRLPESSGTTWVLGLLDERLSNPRAC